jgi:hypothetical protein
MRRIRWDEAQPGYFEVDVVHQTPGMWQSKQLYHLT